MSIWTIDLNPIMPLLIKAAESRTRKHAGSRLPENRPLNKGFEIEGVIGECAVALLMGWPWTEPRAIATGTDRGYDFEVDTFKIDVKATRYNNLVCRPDRVKANLYILCRVKEGVATLLGWATADEVRAAPVIELKKGAPKVHTIYHRDLHPMDEFPIARGR